MGASWNRLELPALLASLRSMPVWPPAESEPVGSASARPLRSAHSYHLPFTAMSCAEGHYLPVLTPTGCLYLEACVRILSHVVNSARSPQLPTFGAKGSM
jgi:hypothetical protein